MGAVNTAALRAAHRALPKPARIPVGRLPDHFVDQGNRPAHASDEGLS